MKRIINLSVHDIVDLLLRKGDIDNRVFNNETMEEGTRLHKIYQDKQGDNYIKEYFFSHTFEYEEMVLNVQGRADGVIVDEKEVVIDEIKTTNADIEAFHLSQEEWHLGQAKIYGYIFLLDHEEQKEITLRLTYISQDDNTLVNCYDYHYSREELEAEANKILLEYVNYVLEDIAFRDKRNAGLTELVFPYDEYRSGQDEMVQFVYDCYDTSSIGFLEAKTGLGKTIGTLYPFLKKLGEDNLDKIFYLTSKNSIKEAAYNALRRVNELNGRVKAVILSSKDKLCINEKKKKCNPDECPYSKGYYDKINKVIRTMLANKELFNYVDILEYAREYEICPFEMQLDLSNHVDVIVGDYNYLYDSRAKLIRYFEVPKRDKDYLLLIDEGHNLPSRVRDMHSCSLSYFDITSTILALREEKNKHYKSVIKLLDEFVDFFASKEIVESDSKWENIKESDGISYVLYDLCEGLRKKVDNLFKVKDLVVNDSLVDLYYKCRDILDSEDGDERYAYYYTFDQNNNCRKFSISCLDSRKYIKEGYSFFKSAIIFSATLTPRSYYLDLLGADSSSPTLYLDSPFSKDNRLVIVNSSVSTFYKDRRDSLSKIVYNILAIVKAKVGNYFVFFPSFEYLNMVNEVLSSMEEFEISAQTNSMSDEEREAFLTSFKKNPTKTHVGLLVLGGIFSEGIDLVEDRLIGAIIVSVGLPKMSYIEDKVKSYFDLIEENGYNYAYVYPGLNKVIQAAGRVIRTENDKGVICFIDIRYNYVLYKETLNETYGEYKNISNVRFINSLAKEFWNK